MPLYDHRVASSENTAGIVARLAGCRRGNITISFALSFPVVLCAMALGIDYGMLTLQKRELQSAADLASIAATGSIASPEKAVLAYFKDNGLDLAIKVGDRLLTHDGYEAFSRKAAFEDRDGYVTIERGRYVPDPAREVAARFEAGAQPGDAARVTIREAGKLYFAKSFTSTIPEISASGMSAVQKAAAFSVGSRLASLNGGVINGLLGSLLGTTVNLDVMDYRALVAADVSLLKVIDLLASDIGLTAGTYSDVLSTRIGYPQLLGAIGKAPGLSPAVAAVVKGLEKTVNKTKISLKLGDMLSLGPLAEKPIGLGDTLSVKTDVFGLVNAAAVAGNGDSQVSFDLGAVLPGVIEVKVNLAIGAPPVQPPSLAVGMPGSIVRTAQTRLSLVLETGGVTDLLGLKVRLPVYVEAAYAEGRLAAIRCSGGGASNGSVDVEAVPGVAEITVGDVDTSAFAHFGTKPRAVRAELVSSPLLKITALAAANTGNLTPKTLTFSAADIASGKVRTVSSRNTLTALVGSLLGDLELKVDILGLPLLVPKALTGTLAAVLTTLTAPLDSLLYNLLGTLGVRIGEVDVRANGVLCQNPALVQ